eukprot:scaffold9472_cov45-Phaeocystis_antarctica.AAC.3
MRDQSATLSVLEVQGQAVNAISARLGATTGQVSPSPYPNPSPSPTASNLNLNLTLIPTPTPTLTLTLTSRSCAPSSQLATWAAPARATIGTYLLNPPPRTSLWLARRKAILPRAGAGTWAAIASSGAL